MMRTSAKIGIILVVGVPVCVCFLFGSCALFKEPVISPYHDLTDDQQIYSLLFDSLCGNEQNGRRYAAEIRHVFSAYKTKLPNEELWIFIRRWVDSVLSLPDSLLLDVCVSDSTKEPEFSCQSLTSKFLLKEKNVDPSFHPLVCSLFEKRHHLQAFDKNLIRSRYAYRVMLYRECNELKTLIFRRKFSFSEIAYDSSRTICYIESWSGDATEIWFLRKVDGDWIIAHRITISVS